MASPLSKLRVTSACMIVAFVMASPKIAHAGGLRDADCTESSLYFNPPDGVCSIYAARQPYHQSAHDRRAVDDVTFADETIITGIAWYSTLYGTACVGDIYVYMHDSLCIDEGPSVLLYAAEAIPVAIEPTEYENNGSPVWKMRAEGLNLRLAAGTYYVGGRTVGYASNASAAPQGEHAYETVGSLPWRPTGQSGQCGSSEYNPDMALCITGISRPSTEFGACCTGDGTCEVGPRRDCEDAGGSYAGDGSECLRIQCGADVGACCIVSSDSICTDLTEADCLARGGEFRGVRVCCSAVDCPLGGIGCDGALIPSQPEWDGSSAPSYRNPGWDWWTVTTVALTRDLHLTGFTWYEGESADCPDGAAALRIYSCDPITGQPRELIADLNELSAADCISLAIGPLEEYPVAVRSIRGLDVTLSAGTYAIGVRMEYDDSNYYSHWLAAQNQSVRTFSRDSNYDPNTWYESNLQMLYCIFGEYASGVKAACCIGGACTLEFEQECLARGGELLGSGTDCTPNECPDAPGACCLSDSPTEVCSSLGPADCAARGGQFRGANVPCSLVYCPLTDLCATDSLGFNGPADRFAGGSASRNENDRPTWLADDFHFSSAVRIEEISWLTIEDSDRPPDYSGCDIAIVRVRFHCAAPPSTPTVRINDWTSVEAIRLGTPDWSIYDRPVYLWRATGLSIDLAAGRYYVSARPVLRDPYVDSRPLLAPTRGEAAAAGRDDEGELIDWRLDRYASGVAVCVDGSRTGSTVGACCQDSNCTLVTSDDCNSAGGAYLGDGSACMPNPCRPLEGACCMGSDCVRRTAEHCTNYGGEYLGDDVCCNDVVCLNAGCQDALAASGPYSYDTCDSLSSDWYSDELLSFADDVSFGSRVQVDSIRVNLIWHFYTPPDSVDFAFFESVNGAPGALVAERVDWTAFELVELDKGCIVEYATWGALVAEGLDLELPPGAYFLAVTPKQDGHTGGIGWDYDASGDGRIFALTSQNDQVTWVPYRDPHGNLSHCIVGQVLGVATGACCLADSQCAQVELSECNALGGSFAGDATFCANSPCPGALGACYTVADGCILVARSACAAAGGVFKGEGIYCNPEDCPAFTDPFVGALHRNGAVLPDRENQYPIVNYGPPGRESAQVIDDLPPFDVPVRLTGIRYASVTGFADDGTAEILILGDACGAPDPQAVVYHDPQHSVDRVQYCIDSIQEWPTIAYDVRDLDIRLEAGRIYWLALRPNSQMESFRANALSTAIHGNSARVRFDSAEDSTFRPLNGDVVWGIFGVPECATKTRGDSNCDGATDFDDINCFCAALLGEEDWRSCAGDATCGYTCANDLNGDGRVSFNDIDGFVECLINNGCP